MAQEMAPGKCAMNCAGAVRRNIAILGPIFPGHGN